MSLFAAIYPLNAQTATIQNLGYTFDDQYPNFYDLEFNFNGISFSGSDTSTYRIPLEKGLDQCYAVMKSDTLFFQARFKEGETYRLSAGCCCAAFSLQPVSKGGRGQAAFKNKSEKPLGFIVGESNSDIVPAREKRDLHAYESAMCIFKPCHMLVTDSLYFGDGFRYDSKQADFEASLLAHEQLILASGNFLFLHKEKVEVLFSKEDKQLRFRVIGHLKEEKD